MNGELSDLYNQRVRIWYVKAQRIDGGQNYSIGVEGRIVSDTENFVLLREVRHVSHARDPPHVAFKESRDKYVVAKAMVSNILVDAESPR